MHLKDSGGTLNQWNCKLFNIMIYNSIYHKIIVSLALGGFALKKNILRGLYLFLSIIFFTTTINAQTSTLDKGIQLKLGLWGIGGSHKSHYQNWYLLDDLINSNQINLDWNYSKNMYIANPIGLEYYHPMGQGALMLGFEARGLPFLKQGIGFYPKYDYMSIHFSNGCGNDKGNAYGCKSFASGVGLHDGNVQFRSYDYTVGYQIGVDKLLITPKFMIRDFANEIKQDSMYFGDGWLGFGNRSFKAPGYGSFLGVNLKYVFNEISSVFFEFVMDSPLQIPLPKIGQLFDNQVTYSKMNAVMYNGGGGLSLTMNGKGTHKISSNRFQLGYQHKFNTNFGVQIGYYSETITSKLDGNMEIPISLSNSDVSFHLWEMFFNKIVTYKSDSKTDIQSLFLVLTYNL